MSTVSEVAIYFPHVGWGQSILVWMPPNRWIVIDANHLAGPVPNPTVDFLRRHADEDSFELIALAVTHFNVDHYRGMVDILELCRELASKRGQSLAEVVGVMLLPRTYEQHYQWVLSKIKRGRAYLPKFLDSLQELKNQHKVKTLRDLAFAWRAGPNESVQPDEQWIFTYFPSAADVAEDTARGRELRENENAYVLGIGFGRGMDDLHFLLTSDVPGEVFASRTREMRERDLPAAARREAGGPWPILPLLREANSGNPREARLRPIQGLAVPHHGSGDRPVRASELEWWLEEGRGPERPALAIVQGGPYALRQNTLDELWAARLTVLATTKPERIQGQGDGHIHCTDVNRRKPLARPAVSADGFSDDSLPQVQSPGHGAIILATFEPLTASLAARQGSRGVLAAPNRVAIIFTQIIAQRLTQRQCFVPVETREWQPAKHCQTEDYLPWVLLPRLRLTPTER